MNDDHEPVMGVRGCASCDHAWRIDVRVVGGDVTIDAAPPCDGAPMDAHVEFSAAYRHMAKAVRDVTSGRPMKTAATKISGHVEAMDWRILCARHRGDPRRARKALAARLACMPAIVDAPRRAQRLDDSHMVAVFVPSDVAARHSTSRGSAAAALRAALAAELHAGGAANGRSE